MRKLILVIALLAAFPASADAIPVSKAKQAINKYESRHGDAWSIGACYRSDGYVVCNVTLFDREWFGQAGWSEQVIDCVDKRGRVSQAGTESDKNDNCLWASIGDE